MKFIDISNWQTVTHVLDIKSYEGVILKATEDNDFTDKKFFNTANLLKSKGIKIGAYHFLRDLSSPESQAEHFYNTIKDVDLDFIPVLDVEQANGIKGSLASEYTRRFLDRFKRLSTHTCIIYSNASYINDYISADIRKRCNFWIAHYGVAKPWIPTGCNCIGWQYTDKGKVDGITGNVDLNIMYDKNSWLINNNSNSKNVYEVSQQGSADVLVNGLRVRTSPSLHGGIVATYNKGEKIYNYVAYIDADNHRWIKYKGGSGAWRYVASRNLKTGERFLNCY